MVLDVLLHPLTVDARKMASGYHSRGDGGRVAIHQFVDQVRLTGQDDRQVVLRVLVELADRMQFRKDLEAKQRRLVNNENHFEFLFFHKLRDLFFDQGSQNRP